MLSFCSLWIWWTISLLSAPELALDVPHVLVFPVAQGHCDGPCAILVDIYFWFKHIMTFENVIGVIGCEFLGQNQLAFWILDRELAFVLAPFVRRSEAHDPGAIQPFRRIECSRCADTS